MAYDIEFPAKEWAVYKEREKYELWV